jgi:hypothetical protein
MEEFIKFLDMWADSFYEDDDEKLMEKFESFRAQDVMMFADSVRMLYELYAAIQVVKKVLR